MKLQLPKFYIHLKNSPGFTRHKFRVEFNCLLIHHVHVHVARVEPHQVRAEVLGLESQGTLVHEVNRGTVGDLNLYRTRPRVFFRGES